MSLITDDFCTAFLGLITILIKAINKYDAPNRIWDIVGFPVLVNPTEIPE